VGVSRWLILVLLLCGCELDSRPQALRRGLDQVRSVLADPRLKQLALKGSAASPEERLVDALFSDSARGLWPPRPEQEYDYSYADQSKLPGRIAYLRRADLPWSVVVVPEPKNQRIVLLGYGQSLRRPLLTDHVSVKP
jgi:hypothetical protein